MTTEPLELEVLENTQAIQRDYGPLLEAAKAIVRIDAGSVGLASDCIVQLTAARKATDAARTFLVKPLNDHVKVINETFKLTAAPYIAEEDRLRKLKGDFEVDERRRLQEVERLAREEEARAQREREAEQRRLAEAAAVPPEQLPEPAPLPRGPVLRVPKTRETASGFATTRFRWVVAAVTDRQAVPRELCSPDPALYNTALARMVQEGAGLSDEEMEAMLRDALPGLRCELRADTATRTR